MMQRSKQYKEPFKKLKIFQASRDNVIIESGLNPGDRVCLTPLDAPVENMKVRVAEEVAGDAGSHLQKGAL